MYLVLSGEGISDLGHLDRGEFIAGPLAYLVDELIAEYQGFDFSYLENSSVTFIDKSEIEKGKTPPRFTGKKSKPRSDTIKGMLRMALNLGLKAEEIAETQNDLKTAVQETL